MYKILVVDDEPKIREVIKEYAEFSGFSVKEAEDGMTAVGLCKLNDYDLIIMDIMMPKLDGFSACKEIKKIKDIPIIMLSAKGEVFDKVLGLELGADDYIEKPFDSKELVARVKAVLRRYKAVVVAHEGTYDKLVEYKDLSINLTNYSVVYMGENIDMPPKEIELLYFLASSPNHVFTREQLLDQIWGYEYIGDTRTVDVHIKRLREKIKDHDN